MTKLSPKIANRWPTDLNKNIRKEDDENFINPRSNYQMNQWKPKMFCSSQICTILKWAVTKLNWFFLNKIHFTLLTFKSNVQLCSIRNVVTRYQVIQDVIYYMEGFNTNISAQFKCKMFLSWAIDKYFIEHNLSLSLSDFVVNHFCFQTSELLYSLSFSTILIGRGVNIPRWQM